jgi:hypothetical protein
MFFSLSFSLSRLENSICAHKEDFHLLPLSDVIISVARPFRLEQKVFFSL